MPSSTSTKNSPSNNNHSFQKAHCHSTLSGNAGFTLPSNMGDLVNLSYNSDDDSTYDGSTVRRRSTTSKSINIYLSIYLYTYYIHIYIYIHVRLYQFNFIKTTLNSYDFYPNSVI